MNIFKQKIARPLPIPFAKENGYFTKQVECLDDVIDLIIWHLEIVETQDWYRDFAFDRDMNDFIIWFDRMEKELDEILAYINGGNNVL